MTGLCAVYGNEGSSRATPLSTHSILRSHHQQNRTPRHPQRAGDTDDDGMIAGEEEEGADEGEEEGEVVEEDKVVNVNPFPWYLGQPPFRVIGRR